MRLIIPAILGTDIDSRHKFCPTFVAAFGTVLQQLFPQARALHAVHATICHNKWLYKSNYLIHTAEFLFCDISSQEGNLTIESGLKYEIKGYQLLSYLLKSQGKK